MTRKWLAGTAALLAAVLLLVLLSLPGSRSRPSGSRVRMPPEVGVEFRGLSVRGRSQGGREWRLYARTVRISSDRTTTTMLGIEDAALYHQGRRDLSLAADTARLSSVTGNLEVAGRVRLTGPAGYLVEAQGLRWLASRQRAVLLGPVVAHIGDTRIETAKGYYQADSRVMECPLGVRLHGPDGDLAGARLTAYLDRGEYVLEGQVTMRLGMAQAQGALASGRPPEPLGRLEQLIWGKH